MDAKKSGPIWPAYKTFDMKADCVPAGRAKKLKNSFLHDCLHDGPCDSKSNLMNMDGTSACRQSLLGGKYGKKEGQ